MIKYKFRVGRVCLGPKYHSQMWVLGPKYKDSDLVEHSDFLELFLIMSPQTYSYRRCQQVRLMMSVVADFLTAAVSMTHLHVFGKPFYGSMIRSFHEVFGSRQ